MNSKTKKVKSMTLALDEDMMRLSYQQSHQVTAKDLLLPKDNNFQTEVMSPQTINK